MAAATAGSVLHDDGGTADGGSTRLIGATEPEPGNGPDSPRAKDPAAAAAELAAAGIRRMLYPAAAAEKHPAAAAWKSPAAAAAAKSASPGRWVAQPC